MKITEKFCTKNQCYQVGKAFVSKGLMLHSGIVSRFAVFTRRRQVDFGTREICAVFGIIKASRLSHFNADMCIV